MRDALFSHISQGNLFFDNQQLFPTDLVHALDSLDEDFAADILY